ncbi:hypothetical protein BT96DRAFT_1027083 [Gymnopus androsaceus JB14]|uniref:Uncharacterized protein n=1 Tax=Gymnopus androsaceus JB14 TaxID=1447944 RepID=A0A6A4GDV8_9AGAR|nr:hypothetical protein BT96DRAFT_1027083 [Gymnopus androsaceus JB14]
MSQDPTHAEPDIVTRCVQQWSPPKRRSGDTKLRSIPAELYLEIVRHLEPSNDAYPRYNKITNEGLKDIRTLSLWLGRFLSETRPPNENGFETYVDALPKMANLTTTILCGTRLTPHLLAKIQELIWLTSLTLASCEFEWWNKGMNRI